MPPPAGKSAHCREAGCTERRLAASEFCARHLNEKLERERVSREKERTDGGGNWAGWGLKPGEASGPAKGIIDRVIGAASSVASARAASDPAASVDDPQSAPALGESGGPARAHEARRDAIAAVRGQVGDRIEAELSRLGVKSLFPGVSAKDAIARFSGASALLTPEQEMQAWRAVQGIVSRGVDDVEKLRGAIGAVIAPPKSAPPATSEPTAAPPQTSPAAAETAPQSSPTAAEPAPRATPEPARAAAGPAQATLDRPAETAAPPPPSPKIEDPRPSASDAAIEEKLAGAARGGLFGAIGIIFDRLRTEASQASRAFQGEGPLDPRRVAAIAGVLEREAGSLARSAEGGLLRAAARGALGRNAGAIEALGDGAAALGFALEAGLGFVRRGIETRFPSAAPRSRDEEIVRLARPLLRALYRHWFRAEAHGLDRVPATGPALIAAGGSGRESLAGEGRTGVSPATGLGLIECAMVAVALSEEDGPRRRARLVLGDRIMQAPLLGLLLERAGLSAGAGPDAAARHFAAGEMVLACVEPPLGEEVVRAAIRARVPVIPCAVASGGLPPAPLRLRFCEAVKPDAGPDDGAAVARLLTIVRAAIAAPA